MAKSSVKAKAIHSGWWIKPGIALLSGALMWCAFSPLNIWPLAWVAPGILMWLIAHSKRARSAMLYAALHAAAGSAQTIAARPVISKAMSLA